LIQRFLDRQATLPLTYAAVGASNETPPDGHAVDRTRVTLGRGQGCFAAARDAVCRWEHFRLGWVAAQPRVEGISVGNVVAVQVRTMGVWWLNACRIVYVIDQPDGPVGRWGFAYGTLLGHAESGEERFLIEWDRSTDDVFYDILAFSRPRHILARIGKPMVRRFQKRFAQHSAAAMVRAVASGAATVA
jgi:uncharacterized protein (UPF0548 family)